MRNRDTFVALVMLLAAFSASAQFSSTVTDISPSQSSFDATDADAASGGRVNSLGRNSNGTTVWAASEWGGLFKSTDSGQNWAHVPAHVPVVTFDVKVDPSNTNRVYATSLYDGRVTSNSGINVSTNGGTSWTKPASATPPVGFCIAAVRRDEPAAYGISVNPQNNSNVVIGTNCGVAISTNAGVTWTYRDPTPANGASDVFDVVVHDNGIIDTCGADGHRRSIDGGINWTTATSSPLPAGRCSLAVSPDESYVLFAAVGTSLFESDNGGTSWPNTFTNPAPQGRVPFPATNQRTGTAFDLWFGDVGLFRESCTTPAIPAMGGARRCPSNSWSASFTRNAGGHDDVGDLIFATGVANDACPTLFASDGGVYRNTLSASPGCQNPAWEQPTTTPHALWLMGMNGADQPNAATESLYFGAQDNGPFSTTNAPGTPPTWFNRGCCDSFDMAADSTRVAITQCCFGAAPANRLQVAPTGMTPLNFVTPQPTGNIPGFRYPDAVARFAANSYVAVSSTGIWTTTNLTAAAVTWTQLGAATTPVNPRAVQVAVSGGTPSFIVQAGVGDGRSADQLWRFNGTGAGSWTQIQPLGNTGGFGIYGVDPTNPNRILASQIRPGLDPRMIMTTNGGTTWATMPALDTLMTGSGAFRYVNQRGLAHSGNAVNMQFGYPQPTFAAFDPAEPAIIATGGADSGVFISIDSGANWVLVTDPTTPATSGRAHIPRPRFAYFDHESAILNFFTRRVDVYVGSQGRGVWRIRLAIPINIFVLDMPILTVAQLDKNLISLDCGARGVARQRGFDCIIRDPIPRNCLVKYDCPGCGLGELCPPMYRFIVEDLDPDIWTVGIVTREGRPVDFNVERIPKGVAVTFRPEKERFKEGSIGDYELVFARKEGAPPGRRYKFKTRLETISKMP